MLHNGVPASKASKGERGIILLSIIFGLVAWAIDTILDHMITYAETGSSLKTLIASSFHELYVHLVILACFVVFGLITARALRKHRQVELALRESEAQFRAIFETAHDSIFIKDRNLRYIRVNPAMEKLFKIPASTLIGQTDEAVFGSEAGEHFINVDARVLAGETVEEEHTKPVNGVPTTFHVIKVPMRNTAGEIVGLCGIARNITGRKQMEEELRSRNRELAMLNRASQTFISSLDLDQVLLTILEEVCRVLQARASSVWLLNPETNELVCRQTTGIGNEVVRGWRMPADRGIVGWVVQNRQNLIVADTRLDTRHYKKVDRQVGVEMRSIVSVLLQLKARTVGVLNVVDEQPNRFTPVDLALVESLAGTAALAIENARLYEQAQYDANTRAMLLEEVNHRVKNNLTAIIGLLMLVKKRHTGGDSPADTETLLDDMVNRIQGLATVHSLLSASQWSPLSLSELATHLIHSILHILPYDKHIRVSVSPAPVRVTPNQANTLALLISELTTNTVKHALNNRNKASIEVTIQLKDNMIRFEYRDDGPGYPAGVLNRQEQNVGLYLIRSITTEQLGGNLTLSNHHGAITTICFPSTTGNSKGK